MVAFIYFLLGVFVSGCVYFIFSMPGTTKQKYAIVSMARSIQEPMFVRIIEYVKDKEVDIVFTVY